MYRVEGIHRVPSTKPPTCLSVLQACTDVLISLRSVVLNGMTDKTEDLSSLLGCIYTLTSLEECHVPQTLPQANYTVILFTLTLTSDLTTYMTAFQYCD